MPSGLRVSRAGTRVCRRQCSGAAVARMRRRRAAAGDGPKPARSASDCGAARLSNYDARFVNTIDYRLQNPGDSCGRVVYCPKLSGTAAKYTADAVSTIILSPLKQVVVCHRTATRYAALGACIYRTGAHSCRLNSALRTDRTVLQPWLSPYKSFLGTSLSYRFDSVAVLPLRVGNLLSHQDL